MSPELRACPFCNSLARLDDEDDHWIVRCEQCCAEGSNAWLSSEAISNWNKRAGDLGPLIERVDRLEALRVFDWIVAKSVLQDELEGWTWWPPQGGEFKVLGAWSSGPAWDAACSAALRKAKGDQ